MPAIPGQLDQRGRAVVNVQVDVPPLRARSLLGAGLQVPGPMSLRGMIDPGAALD